MNPHLFIFIYILRYAGISFAISCKDEKGKDVDWFILYKLPAIKETDEGENVKEGAGYVYITSENSSNWTLCESSIESEDSMLGKTWKEFKDNEEDDVGYLFYNDAAPEGYSGRARGHLKGMLVFNRDDGFWLSHSIPKFGVPDKYEYPKNALTYGQTAICITYSTEYLNDICEHLLYSGINSYERYIVDEDKSKLLDEEPASLFSGKPKFPKKEPFQKEATIETLGGEVFNLFAKSNKLTVDIYSEMIAKTLKTSLKASTWRKGAGTNLESYCEGEFQVLNIESIKLSAKSAKSEISFTTERDHSKWAVSDTEKDPFVCLGDLNRMKSQGKRGGGALCMQSKEVWKAFYSIVDDTSDCD